MEKYCSECGNEISTTAKFCSNCSFQLRNMSNSSNIGRDVIGNVSSAGRDINNIVKQDSEVESCDICDGSGLIKAYRRCSLCNGHGMRSFEEDGFSYREHCRKCGGDGKRRSIGRTDGKAGAFGLMWGLLSAAEGIAEATLGGSGDYGLEKRWREGGYTSTTMTESEKHRMISSRREHGLGLGWIEVQKRCPRCDGDGKIRV